MGYFLSRFGGADDAPLRVQGGGGRGARAYEWARCVLPAAQMARTEVLAAMFVIEAAAFWRPRRTVITGRRPQTRSRLNFAQVVQSFGAIAGCCRQDFILSGIGSETPLPECRKKRRRLYTAETKPFAAVHRPECSCRMGRAGGLRRAFRPRGRAGRRRTRPRVGRKRSAGFSRNGT